MVQPRRTYRSRLLAGAWVALTALGATATSSLVTPLSPAAADEVPTSITVTAPEQTVVSTKRLGTSRQGRAIKAYRLGEREAPRTAVVLGSMHGNETAGGRVVSSLRAGRPVSGVDLWVIPTMNPDGAAANRRGNANGVDLNRNFPHDWAPQSGNYYSGPSPLSEPEARAIAKFLKRIDPDYVVSFHQPLYGIGKSSRAKAFQRRLSKGLGLPIKAFNCTGVCRGTMTSWFNAKHDGAAITVEFSSNPSRAYLRNKATTGTLRAVGGRR